MTQRGQNGRSGGTVFFITTPQRQESRHVPHQGTPPTKRRQVTNDKEEVHVNTTVSNHAADTNMDSNGRTGQQQNQASDHKSYTDWSQAPYGKVDRRYEDDDMVTLEDSTRDASITEKHERDTSPYFHASDDDADLTHNRGELPDGFSYISDSDGSDYDWQRPHSPSFHDPDRQEHPVDARRRVAWEHFFSLSDEDQLDHPFFLRYLDENLKEVEDSILEQHYNDAMKEFLQVVDLVNTEETPKANDEADDGSIPSLGNAPTTEGEPDVAATKSVAAAKLVVTADPPDYDQVFKVDFKGTTYHYRAGDPTLLMERRLIYDCQRQTDYVTNQQSTLEECQLHGVFDYSTRMWYLQRPNIRDPDFGHFLKNVY